MLRIQCLIRFSNQRACRGHCRDLRDAVILQFLDAQTFLRTNVEFTPVVIFRIEEHGDVELIPHLHQRSKCSGVVADDQIRFPGHATRDILAIAAAHGILRHSDFFGQLARESTDEISEFGVSGCPPIRSHVHWACSKIFSICLGGPVALKAYKTCTVFPAVASASAALRIRGLPLGCLG